MIKLGSLKIDPSAIGSQGNAILGIRDSGKTYTATVLAEKLFESGIPFIAFDPIGVWRFLRVPGKGRGYPVVVAGGQEGDLPLTVAGAPEIVRAAMANGVSLVIDLFDINLSKADWKRIVTACVRVLLHENSKHGLRHVFIEEAAEFAPQRVGPDQGQVYAEMEKLARMGGNSRLGYTLINQRAEEVNKALLELCDNLFLHRQKGRNSLTALSKWLDIGNVAASKIIVGSLPTLPTGECWAWLAGSETPVQVTIPQKNSLHPDRRIMRGVESVVKKAIDVGSFVEKMRGTLKNVEVEAKSLEDLRAEVASLKRQLRDIQAHQSKAVDEALLAAKENTRQLADRMEKTQKIIRTISELSAAAIATVHQESVKPGSQSGPKTRETPARASDREAPPSASAASDAGKTGTYRSAQFVTGREAWSLNLPGPEKRILDALADLLAIAVPRPHREQVAFLAGDSNLRSKGFANGIGALHTAGHVAYPESGRVEITESGLKLAKVVQLPLTNESLHDRICSMLGGASSRILNPLIDVYPEALEREALAAKAGYENLRSKGFANAIGRLRTLGFIDYPERGFVVASSVLFPVR